MKHPLRSIAALFLAASLAGAVGFAQSSGEAVYKARCLNCHGTTGLANSGIGKVLKVKPVTDPDVKKISRAAMIALTETGTGKMQGYKNSLSGAQIRDSVDYFRSFIK